MAIAEHISRCATVPENLSDRRLDQVAARLFSEYSRARLQQWIKAGELRVNGRCMRPRDKLLSGDELRLETTLRPETGEDWHAEAMPLPIVHEDGEILVINKPAGVVVHPAAGNHSGTLLNGLLHHCPALGHIPRAGIVHRLDKDTTGLMVVAKTLRAHHSLVQQLQSREVTREYEALVRGVLTAGGTIDLPLGRHPVHRKKRAVVEGGKEAVTHYRIVKRFRAHTLLRVRLDTGRTHQIRVHMSHIRHPLVGDPVYGGRLALPRACSAELEQQLRRFRRQALHAARLAFRHPGDGRNCQWQVEAPDDMRMLLHVMAADAETRGENNEPAHG